MKVQLFLPCIILALKADSSTTTALMEGSVATVTTTTSPSPTKTVSSLNGIVDASTTTSKSTIVSTTDSTTVSTTISTTVSTTEDVNSVPPPMQPLCLQVSDISAALYMMRPSDVLAAAFVYLLDNPGVFAVGLQMKPATAHEEPLCVLLPLDEQAFRASVPASSCQITPLIYPDFWRLVSGHVTAGNATQEHVFTVFTLGTLHGLRPDLLGNSETKSLLYGLATGRFDLIPIELH
ncbi:MAG: hypothetical protein KVP17_001693 [Porospora cf. gigantea B]|uniref:uncharacterized protein n=2 Tax=Porospora cf. gigantea B TaxID=2853592 RepID=UPI003571EB9F|nr:MAG: hypothetical protein KVP17_001693 [Porospora cf. gigantea B]